MAQKPTESGAQRSEGPEEIIDSQCIVEFRPNDNWDGEYGFDWFRIWDYKEPRCTITSGPNKGKHYPVSETTNGGKDGATHFVKDGVVGRYYEADSNGILKSPQNDSVDPDYLNVKTSFYTDTVDKKYYWANLLANYYTTKTIKGLGRNYIVPWMSLFYDLESKHSSGFSNFGTAAQTSAWIKMIIKKDSTNIQGVRKIRIVSLEDKIRFGKGNKQWKKNNKVVFNYFEFDGPFTSDPEQEIVFPINLTYSISEDWPIKAYAFYYGHDNSYYTLSGQINVIKCVPKEMHVLFVNVNIGAITSVDATGRKYWRPIIQGMSLSEQDKFLNKFLSQAHVIPKIEDESLPLYVDERNMVSYNPRDPNNNIFLHNSSLEISRYLVLTRNRGYVFMIQGVNETQQLGEKLEGIIKDRFNGKYSDYYKIIFLNGLGVYSLSDISKINSEGSLGGIATAIGRKSAIVFSNPSDETVCHELLHCIGLYHSFSNKSQFTYKKCMTSNIMDYRFVDNKYNCLKRNSLFKWQWNEIRKRLENG